LELFNGLLEYTDETTMMTKEKKRKKRRKKQGAAAFFFGLFVWLVVCSFGCQWLVGALYSV
jgi:hypothetical protein